MISDINIIKYAENLVKEASKNNLTIRILGSTAIFLISKVQLSGRPKPIKDIDIIAYRKEKKTVQNFLLSKGWSLDQKILLLSEFRETFISDKEDFSIDVYYDFVDGNHRINLENRLFISFPTLTIPDLLLTKLQRIKLRAEDIWDCCTLLNPSFYSEDDIKYLEKKIGSNWGLYFTIITNLQQLKHLCLVRNNFIEFLEKKFNDCEKSFFWLLRSIIGTKIKWWTEMYNLDIKKDK